MRRLYIDDIRTPKNDRWRVVRTYADALIYMSKTGCPDCISFDHDLGEEKTGYDIVKWMVENDIECPGWIPEQFYFNVHSANPVGKKNIQSLLINYLRHRRDKINETNTVK